MNVCSIASGSSGNCIFAATDNTSILIDAGLSGKKIEEGLQSIGHTTAELDGILVTHEHSDHIKGLGVLARRYGIPIYTTEGTWNSICNISSIGKMPEGIYHQVEADTSLCIKEMEILPFAISHDAAEPVAYRIRSDGKSMAVATDMGMYSEYTISHLRYLDVLFLEANHDIRMLETGRYPYPLKQRIRGERGHLSNEDSGRLLCEILHDDMKHIVLSHLSQENNYPALAFETVCSEVTFGDNPYKSGDFAIQVAKRDTVGDLITV